MAAKAKPGFLQCLTAKLARRPNWGRAKLAEAKRVFERVRDENLQAGYSKNDAERMAADFVVQEVEAARKAKVKAGIKHIAILDGARQRFDASLEAPTVIGKRNQADKLAVGLRSFVEENANLGGGFQSWVTLRDNTFGDYWALMRDVMDNFGKGAFGTQRGKAYMPNVGRELFNSNSTGDSAARNIADAFRKFVQLHISKLNNETAITIRNVSGEGLPAKYSAVRLTQTTPEEFVADMRERLDWDKMRWPNSERIAVGQRDEFLTRMRDAMRRNDYKAFDENFEQTGGRWAVQLQQDYIFKFKSYEAWQEMHDKYGDGSLFDVLVHNMEKAANTYATVKMFGSSPDYMIGQIRDMARDKAGAFEGKAPLKIAKHIRLFNDMTDMVLQHNAMDPESAISTVVTTTANLATAAMLKTAVVVAAPGDFLTAITTRLANNQPLAALMGSYIRTMFPGNYRKTLVELQNAGFVFDELTSGNFIAARLGAGAQYGPAWSRRVADFTMRASLLTRHTASMRAAVLKDMMGRLALLRTVSFDEIPEVAMFKRAGITAREWDAVRENMPLWSPADGTEFFRPRDLPASMQAIGDKFQAMLWNEHRRMVVSTSVEAIARMRGASRPDTLRGFLAYSRSMFMGFPVTNFINFTRLLMATEGKVRRTSMIAAFGLGGALVGAFALQLRGLMQGKELAEMDAEFWLKALATGGALGIWGDYITGAMRTDTAAQIALKAGGPLVSIAGEAWDLTGGAAFQWARIGDRTAEMSAGKWGADVVDFARQNVIPQTWLYAFALERDILEPLQEWLDPVGTKRSQARRTRMAKDQGQPFRRGFEPGNRFLTR